jgi:uncharacterized Zn finger protein (UPF0148 family)
LSDKPQEYDGRCHAKTRAGDACRRTPKRGFVVCPTHGGQLPKVKNAAALRVASMDATREALERLKSDKSKSHDTITEMDRLAAEAIVFKDVCRDRLNVLLATEDMRYEGKTGEQLRSEVVLYERALDRCNTILSTSVRLNIHEKRVELEKQKAILVAAAFRETLSEMEFTRDVAATAMQVFSQKMRAISAEME